MNPEYNYLFKFLLLGDSGVGKTSLLSVYSNNTHTEVDNSSSETRFKVRTVNFQHTVIKTQVFDTAGQDRFREKESNWSTDRHAVLLVFDLTDQVSFNNTKLWMNEYERDHSNTVNYILVGNKSDVTTRRVVDRQQIDAYVASNEKISEYIETSAKIGINVDDAFIAAVKAVYKRLNPADYEKHQHDFVAQPSLRAILIADLKSYIARIESHKKANDQTKIDFADSFIFMKDSRAGNREGNYFLAKSLLTKLETTDETIESIFRDIENKRNDIIFNNKVFLRTGFTNRGIHSKPLNAVINAARTPLQTEPHRDEHEDAPLLRSNK